MAKLGITQTIDMIAHELLYCEVQYLDEIPIGVTPIGRQL